MRASLHVMPVFIAGIHRLLSFRRAKDVYGRDIRAFTPVFDGLCPAMTLMGCAPLSEPHGEEPRRSAQREGAASRTMGRVPYWGRLLLRDAMLRIAPQDEAE